MKTTVSSILAAFFLVPVIVHAQFADVGVATDPLDRQEARKLGLPSGSGFVVTEIFAGTPGEKLELAEGDVISKLDGRPVYPATSFAHLVAGTCALNSEISLTRIRDGEEMTSTATLTESTTGKKLAIRYPFSAPEDAPSVGSITIDLGAANAGAGQGRVNMGVTAVFSMKTKDGTVSIKPTDEEGMKRVIIKDNDDNVVFEDVLSAEEIDKVPEPYRKTAASMLAGNMFNIQVGSGGSIQLGGGSRLNGPKPEKDIDELLEEVGDDGGEKKKD